MTISIKPTASGSTIEQDGGTILSVDGSGNLTVPNNIAFSGTVTGVSSYSDSDALSLFNVSGSAPVYAARAWVNFDGTGTVAIRQSGNVSSITDNGTGLYTLNFTTSMPDVNYTSIGIGGAPASNNQISVSQNLGYSAPTTTSCRYSVTYSNQGLYDAVYVGIAIFR
jgi:hypothetical protein